MCSNISMTIDSLGKLLSLHWRLFSDNKYFKIIDICFKKLNNICLNESSTLNKVFIEYSMASNFFIYPLYQMNLGKTIILCWRLSYRYAYLIFHVQLLIRIFFSSINKIKQSWSEVIFFNFSKLIVLFKIISHWNQESIKRSREN